MFELNRSALHNSALAIADRAALGEEAEREAEALLGHCPIHAPTPIVELPELAGRIGIRNLWIKDESQRLRLGSFKALGGAYAVIRHVLDRADCSGGGDSAPISFSSATLRAVASKITVACATAGNHGRSVAAAARLVGCNAVIFVPSAVSSNRVAAIQAYGAAIQHVDGSYDDAVSAAFAACRQEGWELISDTAREGDEETPLRVMQGYTVMVAEVLRQLDRLPTHVFVQAGVGGLAGAVAAHFALRLGDARPRIIIVEPERAPCVFAGHVAGRPVKVTEPSQTVMAMLECAEASTVALRVAMRVADAFMTVTDEGAIEAVRILARVNGGDPPIISGESGAAGLAGLLRGCREAQLKDALHLGEGSRVLLFSTEGATDPDIHAALIQSADLRSRTNAREVRR